ncbi:MAG: ATP-dependent helicase [Gammaproteobacteria bacterium]|nr:ATP-dependent helicase [Gammaproteobacteria bacterium]
MTKLNKEQQEAVDHKDGPCIVLAGPGAGKTAVLTRRTAKLVDSGVAPERVLLLTFTRLAAKEMLDRAKAINPLCEKVDGGTFHSLATRIVNQNNHLFGKTKPFTILDVEDNQTIVKQLTNEVRNGSTDEDWPSPSMIQRIISFSTNTRMTIAESIFSVSPNYVHLTQKLETIRDKYFDYKIERGLLDYDDCLEYFSALLSNEDIAPAIRAKWDYVLVDEYQDTNQLQLEIVYGLVHKSKANIMVVGDPAQSIYSFRGSAPETMTGFRNRFPKSKIINLDTNYRSTPEIVDVVNSIDKRLGIGFNRTLHSFQKSSDDLPNFVECGNVNSQAVTLADNILESKNSGKCMLSQNAVIVRAMAYARPIEIEFTKRKIPYKIVGGLRIDEAAHVKDLLSLARIATNPQHEPAWLRILTRFKKLGAKTANEISSLMANAVGIQDVVDQLENYPSKKFDFKPVINSLKEFDKSDLTPAEKLELCVQYMEPIWSTIKEWKDDWKDRKKDLESIISIANDHSTVESFLSTITLDYSVDNKKIHEKEPRYEDDMITITTVHGSKGLEWPRVHIPSFISGHIPSTYTLDTKEEMRILYVAVSRAKKELFIYKPLFNPQGSFSQESEFEPMIKPHCNVVRVKKGSPLGSDRINSSTKIDMKAVLAAKMKKRQTA